jgi:hypothetical protein
MVLYRFHRENIGTYDHGYETAIKKAGGIDKIKESRHIGAGDAHFSGSRKKEREKDCSYIETNIKITQIMLPEINQKLVKLASQSMIDDIWRLEKPKVIPHRQIAKDLNVTPGRIAGLIHRNK